MGSAADDFSNSHDFKLCGFLPFVVSVVNPPSRLVDSDSSKPCIVSSVAPELKLSGFDVELGNVDSSNSFSQEQPLSKVCRFYSRRTSRAAIARIGGDPLRSLFGAECWLTGEGLEVQFHTTGGFVLSPVLCTKAVMQEEKNGEEIGFEGDSGCREENFLTPFSKGEASSARKRTLSSKKRKRQGDYVDDGTQVLSNGQILTIRNGVWVKGHVLWIARKEDEVQAVVLLDLYLPSFLWSDRNYWKANPAFTAILSHLSRRLRAQVC